MPKQKAKERTKFILNGPINSVVLKTSLPLVAAFLLQASFNIVDGIFLGRLSADALAAVSISFPAIMIMFAIASGFGVGANSLISNSLGAKKNHEANNIAEHALILGLVFSFLISVFGLIFGKTFFSIFTKAPSILNLVIDYTNVIFLGSIFMILAFVGNSLIRSTGNMIFPMFTMIGSGILNIILDPIFIFVLGLGVKGAAIATVLSRSVSFFAILFYLFTKRTVLTLNIKEFNFNLSHIKNIFLIGFPSSLSQLFMSLHMLFITNILSSFGVIAVAAYGIGFRTDSIAIMPGIAVMNALITLIGQNYGAKKFDRIKKIALVSARYLVLYNLAITILFFSFSNFLPLLFNKEVEVINYASDFFKILSFSYPFVGFTFVMRGFFLGIKNSVIPLMISLLRMVVLSVPFAYFFSKVYGVNGVWLGISSAMIITSIIASIPFFKKLKKISSKNHKIN